MDQAIQGDHSSTPPGLPVKRKRGRPRKDQTVNRMEITPMPPGFEGLKENQPRNADSIDDVSDGIVGQAVSGVVEAAFDAGYLLSVRIGNSDTNLRGVVFKPGHYLPVTAENDVAPHVQMIRRNEMHIHGNNRSRMQNGSPSANQLRGLAQRTINKTTSKGKHAAPTALSVPPVGARGNVVPVVLQPPSMSNGTHQAPRDTSPDLDDDEVHTVEPLAMLPPDVLAPTRQVPVAQNQPLPPQSYAGQQVPQGNAQHGNSSFNGATKAGQEEEGKPAKAAEIRISDELSKGLQGSSSACEMHHKDNREAYKSLPEELNVLQQQPFQAVHSGVPQPISVSQPLKSYPTGRMTELLLALQENLTDNQAPHVKHPSSGLGADNAEYARD